MGYVRSNLAEGLQESRTGRRSEVEMTKSFWINNSSVDTAET